MTTKEIMQELRLSEMQIKWLMRKSADGTIEHAGRRFRFGKEGNRRVFEEIERPAVKRVCGRPDLDSMDMSQLKMEKTKSEVRQNWSKEEAEVERIRREALAEAEAEWSKFLQQICDVARKIIHTDADRELWNKCIKEITKA